MVKKGILWLIAGSALFPGVSGQSALRTAPIPSDPLEMATGRIRPASGRAARTAALGLLGRARGNYAMRSAGRGYDLKVTFTVNSGGQTEYDGAWEMEDVFDPQQGLRWTAKASAASSGSSASSSFAITRISIKGMLYGEETGSYIPLRLQEARAALFDPIPAAGNASRSSIRTSNAVFNGAQLTCILLSGSGKAGNGTEGRYWEESEECIDPQTGLLRLHSQVPGRYYAYDYSNALQLDGHLLPRRVTVTEAGRTVTEISVDSLTELPAADPSLFVPTEQMKARGQALAMAGAQKISIFSGQGPIAPGLTTRAVCVFGLVTATGQLVEAHSLQPSDPNSQAALGAANQMNFSVLRPPGAQPQQHFVFVIERFVTSQ